MLLKVRLYATLQRLHPGAGTGEPFEIDLPEGSAVVDLMGLLNIHPNEVKAVRINGRARSEIFRLHAGDEVDLFPPIGGG